MTAAYNPSRKAVYLMIALVVLGVALKAFTTAPVWIHYDENYYLDISQNYIARGELTPYMWRVTEGTNMIAGSGSGYGILLLTNWMKLVGVSLVNGRVLMFAIGLLTATVMYVVAAKWWESRAAGAVAFVFAIVSTSPFYSYVVRMDAPGMLANSLVLLLHIYAVRRGARWLHFLTGVAVVVAAEFHILGILYLVTLAFYYAIRYLQAVTAQRRIVLDDGAVYFGIGGLIAGLIYIAVHILPDPATYFAISSQCFQCGTDVLNKEFLRLARFILLRSIEFALLIAVLMSAYFRRQAEDRHFLILGLGWLAALALIGPPPFTHYTQHLWPLIAVGTAGFVVRGVHRNGVLSRRRVQFGFALALVSLVVNIGFHLADFQPFELRRSTEPSAAVAMVREVVPQDTPVLASPAMFYPLQDYKNFLAYEQIDIPALRGGTSKPVFLREVEPLVVIGDYRQDDPILDRYMTDMNFRRVMPELWIAERLRSQLGLTIAAELGGTHAG